MQLAIANCYIEIVTENRYKYAYINLVTIASYLAMSELLTIVDAINDCSYVI